MKAVRFHEHGDPEVLKYEDVPDPVPGAGQVLLRVLAAGVNYADATRRRGGSSYPRPTPLPFSPGSEVVGIVEQLGDGVTGIARGATVMAWLGQGGYAERAVANTADLLPVPQGIEPIEALALIIQGLSAALILKSSARLKAGDSVLIEGAAGGVGTLAVQLAKIYGAGRVIGAASMADKRKLVESLGADATVDYTKQDWAAEVKAKNGGRGVDVVLEMTGGAVFEQALDCLAPGGRMVGYGNASRQPMMLNVQRLFAQNQTVTGFFLSGCIALHAQDRAGFVAQLLTELGGYVRSGRLRLQLGGRYKLVQAAEAHRAIESRGTTGKIVLVP
ncbi:MAG TPA: zinc-binding dehydrogenase [Stellaceae bacterium]|nr:zinc-binding dehydrogenase [Stellaceae bacterium]